MYLTAQGAYIKYNKLLEKTWQTEQVAQQTATAIKDAQGQTLTGYFYCTDIVPVNAYGYPTRLTPKTQAIEVRSSAELKLICTHTNTFHRVNRNTSALLEANPVNGKLVLSIPVNTPACGYFLYLRIIDLTQFSNNGSMVLTQTGGTIIPWVTMNTGEHVHKRAFAKARSSSALAEGTQYEYLSGTQLQQKGVSLIPTLGTSPANYTNTADMVRNLLSRIHSSAQLATINSKSPLYIYHSLTQAESSTQNDQGFDPNISGTWNFNLQAQNFSFNADTAFNQAQSFTSFWHDAISWITREITTLADLEVKIMVDIAKYSLVGICKAFGIPQSDINTLEAALDTLEHILIKITNQVIHFLELMVFLGYIIEAIIDCKGYLKNFCTDLFSSAAMSNLPTYFNQCFSATSPTKINQQLPSACDHLTGNITNQSRPVKDYKPSAVHEHVFNKFSQHTEQMAVAKSTWEPDTSKINSTTLQQAANKISENYNTVFATTIGNMISHPVADIVDWYQQILQLLSHPTELIDISYMSELVPVANTLLTSMLERPFLASASPIFKDFMSLFHFDIDSSLLDFIALLLAIILVVSYFIAEGKILAASDLSSIIYPSPLSAKKINNSIVHSTSNEIVAQIIHFGQFLYRLVENRLWAVGNPPDGQKNLYVQSIRYSIKLIRVIFGLIADLLSGPKNWSPIAKVQFSFGMLDMLIKSLLLYRYQNNIKTIAGLDVAYLSLLNASREVGNVVVNLVALSEKTPQSPAEILEGLAEILGEFCSFAYFVKKVLGYESAVDYLNDMQLIVQLAMVLDLASICFADL